MERSDFLFQNKICISKFIWKEEKEISSQNFRIHHFCPPKLEDYYSESITKCQLWLALIIVSTDTTLQFQGSPPVILGSVVVPRKCTHTASEREKEHPKISHRAHKTLEVLHLHNWQKTYVPTRWLLQHLFLHQGWMGMLCPHRIVHNTFPN